MRPKKPNYARIKRIISVLLSNPDGIWLRKLSRDSKIPVSTLHYYLDTHMKNLVENIGARNEEGNFFGVRLVRLKRGVFTQLNDDSFESSLRKILTTNEILSDLD